jgi:hypothetical protein
MRHLAVATAIFVFFMPFAASAQLFNNPFADAAGYRQMRGAEPANANYRLRYEVTRAEPNRPAEVSTVVIDVAPDWSLTRDGDQAVLRDFRLNRLFLLQGDSFVSINGLADLVFRVMERQNRTYLQRITSAAGVNTSDTCDADTELGLALPSAETASATELVANGRATELRCGDRVAARFIPSDLAAPPAAFWPTMFAAMTTHPTLHRRIRETGRPPEQLESVFRLTPEAERRRSWRLIAVETIAAPYPITAEMRNGTAAALDNAFVSGTGQIAADAVEGRAQGGAPTLQTWGQHLRDVSAREGEATAAMLILPTYNMFPALEGSCRGSTQDHPVCLLNRNLRTISANDPAPMALLEIGMAEQANDGARAIAAMQRAQASPNRNHPALGASFALAVLRFDQATLAQARAANLPTDVNALQFAALSALPYNPAYWTDVGDRFGARYDWVTGMMFYDVAFSLPMPSAQHRVLNSKREVMQRMRNDFPDAALPATP